MTQFQRRMICDGVCLYTQPTRKFKTVSIFVYLYLPLTVETVTMNALLPQVLSRGTEKYPSISRLSRHLDELYGATIDTDVMRLGDLHSIVFRLDIVGERYVEEGYAIFRQGLETLAEVITHPIVENDGFKRDHFEQECSNLRRMIESKIDDKRRWAIWRCLDTMARGEGFGLHRLGRVEDLPAITPITLRSHHRHILHTAPVDIFVVGDVEVEGIGHIVQEALRFPTPSTSRRIMPRTYTKWNTGSRIRELTDYMDVHQSIIVLGCRTGVTIREDDYIPLLVMNGLLGGFSHSKLFREVRENHSLAYSVYSSLDIYKGICLMYAGLESKDIATCKQVMLDQLQAIQDGQITDEEFQMTIEALVHDIQCAADDPSDMVDLMLRQILSGRDASLAKQIDAYRSVTIQQVIDVSRKLSLDTVYALTSGEER